MSASKLAVAFSATALLVSVLFATPVGQAASRLLPKNSVGAAQIKSAAVTGSKVKNGSLMAADFRAGQLPVGPKGDPGAQGPKGDPGAPGASATKLWAYVNYNGALRRGSGIASTSKVGDGFTSSRSTSPSQTASASQATSRSRETAHTTWPTTSKSARQTTQIRCTSPSGTRPRTRARTSRSRSSSSAEGRRRQALASADEDPARLADVSRAPIPISGPSSRGSSGPSPHGVMRSSASSLRGGAEASAGICGSRAGCAAPPSGSSRTSSIRTSSFRPACPRRSLAARRSSPRPMGGMSATSARTPESPPRLASSPAVPPR